MQEIYEIKSSLFETINHFLPDFSLSDPYLFRYVQNTLNSKRFSHVDQEKAFVEIDLKSKLAKFYWRRNKRKTPNKCVVMIQNSGVYSIDWN